MPGDIPVNTPVIGLMVAMPGLPLLHVPPGTELDSVMELPTHTAHPEVDGQMIGPGVGFTETFITEKQPDPGIENVIVVTPAAMPVTTPVVDIVPTPGLPLLHTPIVPGGAVAVNVVVWPTQIVVVPVIGEGFGLTTIVLDTEHPPGSV